MGRAGTSSLPASRTIRRCSTPRRTTRSCRVSPDRDLSSERGCRACADAGGARTGDRRWPLQAPAGVLADQSRRPARAPLRGGIGPVFPRARTPQRPHSAFAQLPRRVPNDPDGRVDAAKLEQAVTATTAAVIVQQPNFYGVLEDPRPISDLAHGQGALLIASVDPISLGLLAAPGDYGADLAVGDGQPLGIPLSFGGPYVGFIACKEALVRRMPGRLAGATLDAQGRRGYVLTLQAREQHIRREHATSNITTNHSLMALAATVYLAHMGGGGLKQLAELSAQRAHYLAGQLVERNAYRLAFAAPFLWEFVLRTPYPAEQTQAFMLERGVLPGFPLGRFFPELSDALLVSLTELNHPRAMQRFLEVLP